MLEAGLEICLEATEEKTMNMETDRLGENDVTKGPEVDNIPFGKVDEFKYLGATTNSNNELKKELKKRDSYRKCFFAINNHEISEPNKKIYKTIILPHGSWWKHNKID